MILNPKILLVLFITFVNFTLYTNAKAEIDLTGKTVKFVIPFSDEGGSAKWANFFAPLLSETLPGNPEVKVIFMPGAGSTKAANWFQNQKNGDGTLLFHTSGSTLFPYLLGDPRVKYEYSDWHPVMATGTGGVAYLNKADGTNFDGTANNLKNTNFIYGSQGTTRLDLIPLLAWKMLGMKVVPIFGIKGRGDGRLMFELGEATIDYQTTSSFLIHSAPLISKGRATAMMSWGALDDNGDIIRDPTFPDINTFKEVCQATTSCTTKGNSWDAWKAFFIAGFPVQKIAFLPAGTKKEVIDTYINAFNKIKMRDDFADLSAIYLGKYKLLIGNEAKTALEKAIKIDDKAKAFVKDWLEADYGVVLK